MNAIGQFFAMGGSALYVWGAYGMAFLLIALELLWLGQRRRAGRRQPQLTPQRPVVRARIKGVSHEQTG